MKVLILAALVAIAICDPKQPPLLPEQFTADFEESAQLIVIGLTDGHYYYDSVNKRQAIYRFNGRYDRYCGNVFKNQQTPCRHVVVDGKRYLDFPERDYCCFCCDSSHGCGMLKRDFLAQANAQYEGEHELDENGPYDKWQFYGQQQNDYFHKDGVPRRMSEVPIDYIDFTKVSIGAPDASHFKLPSKCSQKCGIVSGCPSSRMFMKK